MDAADLNRLEIELGRVSLRAAAQAAAIVRRTGYAVVADAQAICPVDTGFLRSSIGVDFDNNGLGFVAGPTANYGAHVEFGTSRMAPRAYMGPAFDRQAAVAVAALAALGGAL